VGALFPSKSQNWRHVDSLEAHLYGAMPQSGTSWVCCSCYSDVGGWVSGRMKSMANYSIYRLGAGRKAARARSAASHRRVPTEQGDGHL
jgi:hypothetical protein